ncbi:glycine-rich domain-containing protein [Algoriphagus sp.]|uniref:glycine-rich domain-containing protein n=1 Tax=Algoriphagus sp. TaxID=1872435 RepID=UPI003919ED15
MISAILIFVFGGILFPYLIRGRVIKVNISAISQGIFSSHEHNCQLFSILHLFRKGVVGFWFFGGVIFLGVGEVKGQCAINVPAFTSTGSHSWTVPSGVTSITVDVWGAGGGGSRRSGSNGASGGGGGGAFSRSILAVTPGSVLTVYVGNGGASSTNGQASWISTTTLIANAIVLAEGGQSPGDNSNTGDRGGRASNGIFNNLGFNGGDGADRAATNRGGGGGGAAGPTGNGGNASGRNGGNGNEDGGNGGPANDNNNTNGNPGLVIGGGGSGAARNSGNRAGGAGARGEIRITYTLPNPTAGAIATAQTICSGGNPAAFTSTTAGTGTGTLTYRWESAVSPFSSWSTIGGATSATYDPPAGLTVSTQYRRITIATFSGVTCESQPTASIQVTVQSVPTAGTIAGAQTICNGGDPVAFTSSTAGTGSGTISYRWESAVSPFSTWSSIAGAASATYDAPSGLTITTQFRRVTVSTLNGVACESSTTPPIQVTVSPNKSASSPTTTSVCAVTGNTNISHTTEGVTGIGTATGLPTGITPSFAGGIITISGNPTQLGTFNYSIPLIGTCGPDAFATGTITVTNCACEEIFTSNGTFTIPNGVSQIVVEAWGGGGAGGGSANNSAVRKGGGGGGGAYSTNPFDVSPNQVLTITVGVGGNGASNANGGNGGFSEVVRLGTTLVRANGGNGGIANGNGGTGGNGGIGAIIAGGNGGNGGNGSGTSGSGGNGGNGGPGGPGRTDSDGSGNGYIGTVIGGGGSGSRTQNSTGIGGNGARGEIRISFTLTAGVVSGPQAVCLGGTTAFSSTMAGGTWSSSNEAVATVNPTTGVVTGLSIGIASIRYTLVGSCAIATSTRTVFVNQPINPGVLNGIQEICIGGTSQFSSTTTNGTWSSSNSAVASVNSTGFVTGITAGTATISYTLPTSGGCPPIAATRTITVTAPPSAGTLTGNQAVCVAGTTTFSSTSPGGIWVSSNPAIATVNLTTGLVAGVAPGTAALTYTVAGTGGCPDASATRNITITAAPISGTLSGSVELCVGDEATFSSTMAGGAWSSSNNAVATVNNSTGQVIAVSAGTATITYTMTGTGGCADATATRNVTVYPLPSPSFTVEPLADVCIGAPVTYTTQNNQFDYDWNIQGIAGTDYTITSGGIGTINHTVSLIWLTPGTKNVSVNYSNANGCSVENSISNSITINPLPNPTFTSSPSNPICIGDEITYTTQAGQSLYIWTVSGTEGTDFTIKAGGIGTNSNTVTIDWLTSGSKTVTINYQNSTTCSGVNPASNTIDLDSLPIPTFTTEPSNPSCIGDEVTYTTEGGQSNYLWIVSGTEGTDYNITAGGLGTSNNTVTIKWLTDGSKTVTVNYQDVNGCPGVNPASNTIDLDPLPVPSFTTQPSNPVCIGDEVTYTTQDGQSNYIWTVSGTVGADYNITNGGIGTTSNTVTIEWLTNGSKTVTVNYQDTNGCSVVNQATNTIEISIYTSIDIQPNPNDDLECFGDGFDPISVSATGSNLSYQWYKKTDNSDPTTNPGTPVTGATLASFTPPSTPEGTAYYYVIVSGNCGEEISDLSGEYIVDPAGTLITVHPDVFDETICFGGSFSPLEVFALGDGGSMVTYQWYQNDSPNNIGGILLAGQVLANFTPHSDASVADGLPRYYYATASSSCGTVPSEISGAFIVNPLTAIENVSLAGTTICENDGPFTPISVIASGIGTLSYQWYSNTTGVINTAVDTQVGTNSNSFTPPSNVADGNPRYYYVLVSSTNGCGPDVISTLSGTFVVNPNNTVSGPSSTPTECINSAIPSITHTTTNATGIGAPTGLPTGVTAIWDADVITITGTPTQSGNFNYSIPLTGGCGDEAATGTITVTPNMTATSTQADGTTCINQSLSAITHSTTLTTGIGAPTGLPAGVTAAWASNVITISGTPSVSGTFNYSIPLNGGCGTVAATGSITVTPDMTVNSSQTDGITCINEPLAAIVHTSTLATGIGTPTGLPSGVTASWNTNVITISGTPDVSGSFAYSIPLTGGCGTVVATGTITVTPNMTATTTDPDRTICLNESLSPITYNTSFVTGIGLPVGLPAGVTATWNTNVITITGTPTGTGTFNYSIPLTGGCGTEVATGTITVNPRPEITNIIGAPICSGDSFTVTPANGTNGLVPTGTTYIWTVVNNPNITGETAQAVPLANISQTLINTSNTNQIVTYTVTPTTMEGCIGNTFTVEITVSPIPTVNPISNQPPVCSGSSSSAVNFSGNSVAGVIYNWTNSNPTIGLAASGSGNIPPFTTTNTGSSPITATITVTPTANGCSGLSESFTITVNPTPIVTILADYCAVAGSVELVASSNVTGTTWLWNTGQTTSSILVNTAGLFSVTATSPNGCITSSSFSVAEELVVDGSFTNFSPASPSFFTEYTQNQNFYVNGNNTTGLWPEGYYAVNVNANGSTTTTPQGYHTNFHGRDHTNNSVGPRNFLMVNGGALIGSPLRQPIIWEQTVTVEPNTEYYFSAWAMNLNPSSPARLQFEINGVLVGTILDLNNAPKPTNAAQVSLDNWRQFYSDPTWSSGDATTATIRIVNLNTALGGNDFGLDDISFGTLSPFIKLTSAVGTDDSQVVCEDSPIIDIEYRVGGGLAGPVVENLPPGITSVWNGVNLRFSGSPTTAGTYNYTIFTTGECLQVRAYGVIVVRDTPTEGVIASDQTVCAGEDPAEIIGDIYTPQETGATISYRWELNTNLGTPNWTAVPGNPSGANYDPTILGATTQYRRFTISTVGGLSCESPPSNPVTITIQVIPSTGAIATDQTICEGGDPSAFTSTTDGIGSGTITYRWEYTNSSNPGWNTIAGATEATYDSPALVETTQFRRVTVSTLNGTACESIPSAPVQVSVTPTNTVTPVNPDPPLCLNTPTGVIIIHTTTGAFGIVPQSPTVNYNLPNGVTPSWNAGVLTVSGTPTEFGVFNYNIPLNGGCGSISATGTITVENPTYPIIAINVVNPILGTSPPFTSTFTVYSNQLTIGSYTINYSIDGINGGPNQTISVNVTTPGQFTFTSLPYSNEGTTILTINSIKKDTENCTYYPPINNTAPYGISCSTEFWKTEGNRVFAVPANIFQVNIQVFGDGLGGNTASQTMSVIPSGAIFVIFDGTNVFATEAPPSVPIADRLAQAIVSTTGPNGRIVITYDCTPPPPCNGTGDVFQYTDSEGYTVIRVTGDCSSWTWTAPDGLDEFEVLVVGGGGGGGYGEAAGGGGGGAVIYQQFTGITMNGLPGLQGATFTVTPGGFGLGASSSAQRGGNGGDSFFSGPLFEDAGGNTFINISAFGGGGGGSTNTNSSIRQGAQGASGGGGAAYGMDESTGGDGTKGKNGGNGIGETFGSAGAGGGGDSSLGENGSTFGSGAIMNAGSGGSGELRTISDNETYYGAGGGGTASGAITNYAGYGGSPYTANGNQFYAGGNGNNYGTGLPATTYGSGGGAGRLGGSAGFQGVIYIRYPNFRILPIEYLYFNASYNSLMRSGDLTWATAKEWENDRFEIERSINSITDWETIGESAGAGFSDQPKEYKYQDIKLPLAGGNIFYRLKQFDLMGETTYSETKAIRVDPMAGTSYWRVYPNPTTGDPINLELLNTSSFNDEKITVKVISATGIFEIIQSKSAKHLSLQLSDILRSKAAGIYTIEISWANSKEYHKVILRR